MRRTTILLPALFCLAVFAQQPPANPSPKAGAPPQELSPETAADKASAYDKWPEKQQLAVAKAMGHDMSKLSKGERAIAKVRMTEKDKVDAYDYYIAHQKPAKKKN